MGDVCGRVCGQEQPGQGTRTAGVCGLGRRRSKAGERCGGEMRVGRVAADGHWRVRVGTGLAMGLAVRGWVDGGRDGHGRRMAAGGIDTPKR